MALLIQQIPALKAPMDDIAREIHIKGINIVDDTKEMFIAYETRHFKNDIDVSANFQPMAKPFYIHNGMLMYDRDLTTFQPKPNPDYISVEETPDLEPFLLVPGYDWLISVFKARPDIIWIFLQGYILENWNDGWFDN